MAVAGNGYQIVSFQSAGQSQFVQGVQGKRETDND